MTRTWSSSSVRIRRASRSRSWRSKPRTAEWSWSTRCDCDEGIERTIGGWWEGIHEDEERTRPLARRHRAFGRQGQARVRAVALGSSPRTTPVGPRSDGPFASHHGPGVAVPVRTGDSPGRERRANHERGRSRPPRGLRRETALV